MYVCMYVWLVARRDDLRVSLPQRYRSVYECMYDKLHDLSQEGKTALMLAAQKGHPAVVQFLLNKGVKLETKHPRVSSKV
jgi:hypothetical protein